MQIKAQNLVKIYGDRRVVNDISFNVNKGEVVGLLGPNGAGKTTTFYMIVGLVKANSGKVYLDDEDITNVTMSDRALAGIGYLPQESSIFRKLTVEDNIKLVLELNEKLSKDEKKQKLEDLLNEFGVAKLRKEPSIALSGGERRRVELARALAASPEFILLDEPFTGIDPIAIGEIKDKIIDDVHAVLPEVKYCSQLKLLGNYYDCHSLNTAILATALGYKLNLDEDYLEKITKAALLHDIGMTKLPKEILEKTVLSQQDTKVFQTHTQIGYKILKYEMSMPEDICLVALEHHENNDGSGYPFKLSGEQISEMARIIGMCSFFDDLTSNRTPTRIKNTKDALRIMLEVGSKKFTPQLLYQFVNMYNYNDLESYEEMAQ